MAYFDRSGDASDEPVRWANFSDVPTLKLVPGIAFQPVTTDSVMTNFVTFEPNAVADMHHHSEQQIAIVIAGELTLTVGGETRVAHAGDCSTALSETRASPSIVNRRAPRGGECRCSRKRPTA